MSRLGSLSLWVSLSMVLGGCSLPFISSSTKAPVIEEIKRTPASKIIISELDILDRPYVLLGEVRASEKPLTPLSAIPTKEELNAKLREEAAKMDADAIIFVSYKPLEKSWKSWGGMEAVGKAVKFKYY